MKLPFEKWHGCKNDFAIFSVNTTETTLIDSLHRRAAELCARDGGAIGADGIIVIASDRANPQALKKLYITNSDGSQAMTCGNGLRCAAGSVLRDLKINRRGNDLPEGIDFHLLPLNQDAFCRFLGKVSDNIDEFPYVCVDMGVPTLDAETSFHKGALEAVQAAAKTLSLPQITRKIHTCSIGNQHIVTFVDEEKGESIYRLGPALQKNQNWDGINVHLVMNKAVTKTDEKLAQKNLGAQGISELYQAWVWERGAGPTQACGSGACAIGAAVLNDSFADRKQWLGIDMPGGRLYVRQSSAEEGVELAGPAELVFTGEINF